MLHNVHANACYVLHRAIVRNVLIGQRDRKFVNDSLCNALLFLRCSLLFHTSRLLLSWPFVVFTEVNLLHESTRHVVNLTHTVNLTVCRVDSKPSGISGIKFQNLQYARINGGHNYMVLSQINQPVQSYKVGKGQG